MERTTDFKELIDNVLDADHAWNNCEQAQSRSYREDYNAARKTLETAIDRITAERDGLKELLSQARQYVSDAGDDEDPETQHFSHLLLVHIDAAFATSSDTDADKQGAA